MREAFSLSSAALSTLMATFRNLILYPLYTYTNIYPGQTRESCFTNIFFLKNSTERIKYVLWARSSEKSIASIIARENLAYVASLLLIPCNAKRKFQPFTS